LADFSRTYLLFVSLSDILKAGTCKNIPTGVIMKLFLFVLLTFFLLQPGVSAQQIFKATVEKQWSVDLARQEAFEDLQIKQDLSLFNPVDPFWLKNKKALLMNAQTSANRRLIKYSDNCYSVRIYDDKNFDKVFYYSPTGELEEVDFDIFEKQINSVAEFIKAEETLHCFPCKKYKYTYPEGKLIEIIIEVSTYNQYGFRPDGTLKYHWSGNTCFDEEGNVVMTRKTEVE
jgi:hypothetical protein